MKTQQQTPTARTLAILSSVPVIMVLGNSMLIPVLPAISRTLQVSPFQVSLLITLFSIPAAITIPLAGILSDRIGRKKVIAVGLLLYGAGGLLAGLASIWGDGSYIAILLSRILQGIGAAGTAPIAMVLTSDLYQQEKRSEALGIIEAANAMGKVLSPILGSILGLISWYAMFFLFPILTLPIILLLWYQIEESIHTQGLPLHQYKKNIKKIFRVHGRWLFISFASGSIVLFSLFGVLFYISDYLEKTFHLVGVGKGIYLSIPLLSLSAVSYWTGKQIGHSAFLTKRFIIGGLGVIALSLLLLPWFTKLYLLLSITALMGLGSGLVLPCLNTMITSAIGLQERGIITSLYGSVRFLGVALGPPIYGALISSPKLLFIGNATILLIAIFFSYHLIENPQHLRGKNGHSRLLLRKKRLYSP
ncbi:MFS transporter [Hazenella sp. IB182357]|uniref:MFS transporter n=1 Tax=Polycladospora coralii TaxID=2771432 RepID=A0A926RY71_9BACL|nr:MFS transporter [Polycladospora coralii]MBD1373231.1 MFS transporter [Polycladospora coralii]MBS7530889.1 MFS transporter [Polycladospora coralii]